MTALPDAPVDLARSAQPALAPAGSWRQSFVVILLAVLDLGLIEAVFRDGMAVERAIVAHSAVVLALALLSALLVPREALSQLSRLLLLLLSGPLGGPTMLAGLVASRFLTALKPAGREQREGRKQRPASERLLDDIRSDRRRRPGCTGKVSMTWTMTYGTDPQRFALLGVIARTFVPEMRPALDLALRSPDAALRVQSASVFAKLRDQFARRAAEIVARHEAGDFWGAAPAETSKLIAEIRRLVASGFLEDGPRDRLGAIQAALEPVCAQEDDARSQPTDKDDPARQTGPGTGET